MDLREANEKIAYAGTVAKLSTLADGSWRLVIDLPEMPEAPRLLPRQAVAVAALSDAGAVPEAAPPAAGAHLHAPPPPRRAYGDHARALKLSGFCRSPDVWRALGTDDEFLAWLRGQRCAARGIGPCEGDIVAAHVRRIANGAGMGVKPGQFSAVPLCNRHHQLQHQKGESAFAPLLGDRYASQ